MKIKLLFVLLLVSSITALQAQKKSELISEIATLKMQIDSVSSEVTDARKKEKVAQTESVSYKSQVTELQDANRTLMKSLTSFTEVSTKNSSNFNMAMESLNDKEQQLKAINDAIASNDSIALVVLTNAKQTLGENAKIGVSNGGLVISEGFETLFGKSSNATLTPEAEPWIGKIAAILKANPEMNLTVEGLSMTGELALASQQATAISLALQQQFEINPERITGLGRDGNLKEGISLKIHPKYDEFYMMVKENMKN